MTRAHGAKNLKANYGIKAIGTKLVMAGKTFSSPQLNRALSFGSMKILKRELDVEDLVII